MPAPKATLLSIKLWAKHEAFFFKAFLRAIELLAMKRSLPAQEVELNRRLYFCLLQANRELDPDGLYPPPYTECCNQPDPDDDVRAKREAKRPDFVWGFTDPHEADSRRSSKQFIVECKRLGAAPRYDWVLNSNYVDYGICRFCDPTWGYGKRFASAAMVGYLQSMQPWEVLEEVNQANQKRQIAAIILSKDGWQIGATSRLEQEFTRSFPVSPFRLRHIWIDLRPRKTRVSKRDQPLAPGNNAPGPSATMRSAEGKSKY